MADNPDPFDVERANRMKALQMVGYFIVTSIWGLGSIWLIWDFLKKLKADLGTARREHISTVDRPNKLHHTNIQQIEAIRDSNQKGTTAYKMAEENRDKLNSWATYHETLDENQDTENLDPLLDGQTHRLGLEARVKERGLGAPVHAIRGKKATRGGFSSGRGGGVSGTQSHKVTRSMTSGDFRKPEPHRLTPPKFPPVNKAPIPPLPKKLSDPSKDCNNPVIHDKPEKKRYGQPKPISSVTKTRRPVFSASPSINFESLLADGDDFMAAVNGAQFRNIVTPSKQPTPPAPPVPPVINEKDITSSESSNDVRSPLPLKVTEDVSLQPEMPKARVVTSPDPPKPQVALSPIASLRIDVFTNPPVNVDAQGADAATSKTDHGFGSYLPQPQRVQQTDDFEEDDLLLYASSEEAIVTRPESKSKGSGKLENFGTSLLDTSNELEEPVYVKPQQSQPKIEDVEPKPEPTATELELLKITKLLSNLAMLDPDVVLYLQERKGQLERELAPQRPFVPDDKVDGNARELPEHGKLEASKKTEQIGVQHSFHPLDSQKLANPSVIHGSDGSTTGGVSIKNPGCPDVYSVNQGQPLKGSPDLRPILNEIHEQEEKDLKIRGIAQIKTDPNTNKARATPFAPIFDAIPTDLHAAPLIIGDHLLPGRSLKQKSDLPNKPPHIDSSKDQKENKPLYSTAEVLNPTPAAGFSTGPRLTHNSTVTQSNIFNPAVTFNQPTSFKEPVSFTYPEITTFSPNYLTPTVTTFPNQPGTHPFANITNATPTAPISRFKMRDTPIFPFSATTMQYFSGPLTTPQVQPATTSTATTNENRSPAMSSPTPHPTEVGGLFEMHSRRSSSSLSPAAPSFQPLALGRDSNPSASGVSLMSRTKTSHHSKFPSAEPVQPQEAKSIFVTEMAKHGVSVSALSSITNTVPKRKKPGMESSKYAH